jgi:hypothetical protein
MKQVFIAVLIVLSLTIQSLAQDMLPSRKGQGSIHWGWNRAWYTKSDLHMQSGNSDFVLYKIKAHDRQSAFGLDPYFNPIRISIPQTNFHLGYFISDNWEVNLGFDHMKYVMDQEQTVGIEGTIDGKTYDHDEIVLTRDFFQFEHTDGLNYIYGSAHRHFPFIQCHAIRLTSSAYLGGGMGLYRPRTDAFFMGVQGPNDFHVAGYGANVNAGLSMHFFKYFSVRTELKTGFVNMPDIRPTAGVDDYANQKFWYVQHNIVIGYTMGLLRKG